MGPQAAHAKITSEMTLSEKADAIEEHMMHELDKIVTKSVFANMTDGHVDMEGGAALMKKAFSVHQPVITIDDISTENGRSIQLGYMEIFAGSMTGIRNPKAHLLIDISRERAIHFLFLASLLMDTLDYRE